jgi:hypothetical protein
LNINEGIACRKIIGCTAITKIKQLESIYLKQNINGRPNLAGVTNTSTTEVSWKLKFKMRKWTESRKAMVQ